VAYAFGRDSASDDWRQIGIIEPPVEGDHSGYASSLALASADELFIGAPAVDSIGVVYHFMRQGGTWSLHAVLRPESDSEIGGFGQAITQEGDWLLIGAPGPRGKAGTAFFFQRQANGDWSQSSVVELPRSMAGPRAGVGSAVLKLPSSTSIGIRTAPGRGRAHSIRSTRLGERNSASQSLSPATNYGLARRV